MWKNNMQAIANIGAMTRPQVRNLPTLDLAGAIDNYYNAKDAQTKRLEAEAEKQRRQAYSDALQTGNQDAINQAWAAYDPQGYSSYLNQQQQRAEDRQWQLEDMARKERAAYGLAQFKQNIANAAAQAERERENAQLDEALKSGLITDAEYNKRKRMQILGDIVNGGDINMNNPFDKAMVQNFAKDYDKNVKDAQSTYDKYANADRLLDKIETGGLYNIPIYAEGKAAFNPDVAQFIAAQNELIPTMRPTGSGSTSDKDMAIFAKATFGIDKPKEANRNIIRGRMAAAENERDYNQLKAQWISAGGNPVMFDQEWNQYLEMNPIFSNDNGELNKTRVSGKKWFNAPQTSNNSNGLQVGQKIGGFTVVGVE